MSIILKLAFLFFIGSILGWIIELFFRRFISRGNVERKWINPGFCTGPYIPLYGFGLCIGYLFAELADRQIIMHQFWNQCVFFIAAALCITIVEYIAGLFCLKVIKVRLWDYRKDKWNIQGIICPQMTFIWMMMIAVYYFFIHQHILEALAWLADNMFFTFFIGFFFGVFVIDVIQSAQRMLTMKAFAEENMVIIGHEKLKAHIRSISDKKKQKAHFFRAFESERPLKEHLKDMSISSERYTKKKNG